jgi:ferredoxin
MPMKVAVDRDRCQGIGVCMGIAPEVFDVDGDRYLNITGEIPDDKVVQARVQRSDLGTWGR